MQLKFEWYIEKLEQLRALEMGIFGALEVDFEPIGVDTPEDIHKIEEVIRSNKKYIFITGGVSSSLGKGLAAASIAAL